MVSPAYLASAPDLAHTYLPLVFGRLSLSLDVVSPAYLASAPDLAHTYLPLVFGRLILRTA